MIRLFVGFDAREAIGSAVFAHSVIAQASVPVAITALDARGLPVGSNAFTYSRFLAPWLCGFQGLAIFMDGADMLMRADLAELADLFDTSCAVQVVQHQAYRTRHPLKYRNTGMQCPNVDYPRKNWASVMLLNCAHPHWRGITPETLPTLAGRGLLQFDGLDRDEIGALPDEWNRLVDEGQPVDGAKVLHWTAGIPAFPFYAEAPGAEHWHRTHHELQELA